MGLPSQACAAKSPGHFVDWTKKGDNWEFHDGMENPCIKEVSLTKDKDWITWKEETFKVCAIVYQLVGTEMPRVEQNKTPSKPRTPLE